METNIPQTVAIIMDGNGRWAKARGLPRTAGHKQGAEAIRVVALAANQMGIKKLMENNIRVTFAGELERFPKSTQSVIRKAVDQTANNTGLNLDIAINYGSRRELVLAMQQYAQDVADGKRSNDIDEAGVSNYLMVPEDVDLLIRTSGELRLSNFLLWQIAYAEFIFTPIAWPDFDSQALADCIKEFQSRHRRFGGLEDEK